MFRDQLIRFFSWLNVFKYRSSLLFKIHHTIFHMTSFEDVLKSALLFSFFCKIEGDYLEFGLYEGKSFIIAYWLANKLGLKNMDFYGFDSFSGLPEIKGLDLPGIFKKGMYACDRKRFENILKKSGINLNHVTLIEGWYNQALNSTTKNKLVIKKAAIIYIDCDLYESTTPVLNFITSYIQDGTVILFDDWFHFRGHPQRGEQRAFKEWLKNNPQYIASEFYKFGWSGNSFIINLK